MDRETDNELLNTVLAAARKLGIAIELEALDVSAGDDRIDALARDRHKSTPQQGLNACCL